MDQLDNIHNQLKSKIEEYVVLLNTDKHLADLKNKLKQAYDKRASLEKLLRKEERDVENLENRSVKKLFYKVLGSEQDQLEKERQEYLNVSLQYNNCQDEVELLEFEQNILIDKTTQLPVIEEQVKQLKKLREKEILTYTLDSPVRTALTKTLLNIDEVITDRKEHLQALDAGKDCLQQVKVIYDHLLQAKNWGQWSNQQSSSRIKYHAIDRARRHLPRAQMLLNQFRKELLDIGVDDDRLNLQLEEVAGFSGIFFDNIITDWIVSQKLHKSMIAVKQTHAVIDAALIHVNNELVALDQQYNDLILQKDNILLED